MYVLAIKVAQHLNAPGLGSGLGVPGKLVKTLLKNMNQTWYNKKRNCKSSVRIVL